MALINPPAWLQQGSYPAKTDRQVVSSIFQYEGVLTGFETSQTATASMSVIIGPGRAVINGTSVEFQGMYNVVNDAPVSITIPGSNTNNPRYDLVVVTINDADVSGTLNNVEFKVISGVPASSPTVPSIPASTLVLARIFVGAGVSSIPTSAITDVRLLTAPRGSIVQLWDAAARLRITSYPVIVSEGSTGILWRNSGSGWEMLSEVKGTYVPEITGPTSINYGTGAVRSGKYTRVGSRVTITGSITFGTGMSIAAGDWFLSLPFAASGSAVLGTVWMTKTAGSNWTGLAQSTGPTSRFVVRPHGASFVLTNVNPWAWSAGDLIMFELQYEVA